MTECSQQFNFLNSLDLRSSLWCRASDWALICLMFLAVINETSSSQHSEIKLIIFAVSLGRILIKSTRTWMWCSLCEARLSHRKNGEKKWKKEKWVSNIFSQRAESCTRSKKKQQKTECSTELKPRFEEQWHIMYHLTHSSTALNKAADSRMIE